MRSCDEASTFFAQSKFRERLASKSQISGRLLFLLLLSWSIFGDLDGFCWNLVASLILVKFSKCISKSGHVQLYVVSIFSLLPIYSSVHQASKQTNTSSMRCLWKKKTSNKLHNLYIFPVSPASHFFQEVLIFLVLCPSFFSFYYFLSVISHLKPCKMSVQRLV